MFLPPENITTVPYTPDTNPYKGSMFDKYLLNKPVIYQQDDGEKIVVYHFIGSNSTEFFPLQAMLHPQSQYRGFYKIPKSMKLFHFPKPNKKNYFEINIKTFEPLSDVDKIKRLKKDLIINEVEINGKTARTGFITEEDFYKFVEDKMNYHKHIADIDTYIDFSFDV